VASLAVGLFGASTGAAAALRAAAERPNHVRAVVSRGGRPDLAEEALARVQAPTLLIVGGLDTDVVRLNRYAADELHCEHRVVIVPGATHLFDEPGKLDEVARLASDWFVPRLATHT
jgi:pimeloyl-ACP methyl ester carboxylesterase